MGGGGGGVGEGWRREGGGGREGDVGEGGAGIGGRGGVEGTERKLVTTGGGAVDSCRCVTAAKQHIT